MSESVTIVCDRCHERVARASRTRIRWSAQPARREPTDHCPSCRDSLLEHWGLIPPALPGLLEANGKGKGARP